MCIVYIPPENSTREKRLKADHFRHLKEKNIKINSENILLIGDFNARTKTFEDTLAKEKHLNEFLPQSFYSKIKTERSNQDITENRYGKKLIEYCVATQSYIANGRTLGDFQGKYTYHQQNGSSVVDYAILSENLNKYIRKFQVLDPSVGSDHCPIIVELSLPQTKRGYEKTTTPIVQQLRWNEKTKRSFLSKVNSNKVKQEITEIHNLLSKRENIDIVIEKLCNIYYPSKNTRYKKENKNRKQKQNRKKWYDRTCHEMSKKMKLVAKLCAESPSNPYLRGSLCKTRKEYKKLLKMKKKEWKNQMIQELEKIEGSNPQKYWKLVNDLREKKQNDTTFDTEDFTVFFEKLYSKDAKQENKTTEEYVLKTLEGVPNVISESSDFTIEELKKAVNKLKNNKSAGPDRIPGEMIKASPEHILLVLLKIMNMIKLTYQYPTKWAMGITSLLFKDGSEEDPNNYRAITVADALSKILAIMINERLEEWCQRKDIMQIEQIGFKKKSRPGDHLFVLKTLIDHYNSLGQKVVCLFCRF